MVWFTVKLHNDLSYKVKLVNISFEFCAFNLRPCAIPKNKIGVINPATPANKVTAKKEEGK